MKKHQFRQDALIEVLHKAQELFGYLEHDLLLFIAAGGRLTVQVEEKLIPVREEVHAACEGRFAAFVAPSDPTAPWKSCARTRLRRP